MSTNQTVKQYGELAVAQSRVLAEQARTPILAVVGAGDLALEQARAVLDQFRNKAASSIVALPGEAQVQADLAVREARTRATEAAGTARTTAQQLAGAVRPDALRSTVTDLVESARTQATTTLETLAERGAEVVEELRHQPAVRRVVRRAEDGRSAGGIPVRRRSWPPAELPCRPRSPCTTRPSCRSASGATTSGR